MPPQREEPNTADEGLPISTASFFFFFIINFLKETIPRSLHYSHLDARKLAGCWVSAHIGHGSRHVDSTAIKMQ